MNTKTIIINRPHWIEMGMIFAAGFVVGRFTQPTKAEKIQVGNLATVEHGTGATVIDCMAQTEVVQKKPLIEYADGKVSFNLFGRR